ncbi:MAG: hypothetical protein FJ333_03250 [Sphingomonadales bacterium]|nr:hypothetical protein [Sphingomonadales bacterium]
MFNLLRLLKMLWVLLIAVMVNACSNRAEITAAEMGEIVSLGHGGMGINSSFPLNSAEGINKCLDLGLDGSEIDVQMTADSILVAFHDVDLTETTQLEGRIHASTWAELQNAEYTGSIRGNCGVVSLNDLFLGIENPQNFHFTFDCKLHRVDVDEVDYHRQFATALKHLLQAHQLGTKIAIESQNVSFLQDCERELPLCELYYYPASFIEGFETATVHGFHGITMDSDKVSADEVDQIHAAGLKIALWNVKSGGDNWKAINKRPDFIQSDDPRHLKNALK